MKRLLGVCVALAFLLVGTAHGMGSKPSNSTGDKDLDSTLEKIGLAAREDPDGFVRQLSLRHDIPEQDIRQAMERFDLEGRDIFMATALAGATHRPVLAVAERYRKGPGKGWGELAKDLGIKPGSREFHNLKDGADGFLDHMRATADSRKSREREEKSEGRSKDRGGR